MQHRTCWPEDMIRVSLKLLPFTFCCFLASVNGYGMASNVSPSSIQFAVIGVGVLGTSLCRQLLLEFQDATVVGITKSDNRHDSIRRELQSDGCSAIDRLKLMTMQDLMSSASADETQRFQNVVFCAPPSGFDDYPMAVQMATEKLWQGSDTGNFVFTSSGAVYGPGELETVTESSPTVADVESNPRVSRLLQAEKACLQAGGYCLRLAGLYNLNRGAHNFWITQGKVTGSSDGLINQLHYDDAASACLAALKLRSNADSDEHHREQKNTFLISDGHPMTRREICSSALQAHVYKGYSMPSFPSYDDDPSASKNAQGRGKIYDGSLSNQRLGWSPRYESFDRFMKDNA